MNSVAIIGRPNVGKSALFNRLIGRKIAIVHDQPGITRDRLSAICTRGERPFTLLDTGGIAGAGESQLVAEVQRVVRETISESNLLLLVVDAKSGLSPMDQEIARIARKSAKPCILVINKIDDEKQEHLAAEFDSLGFEQNISISAEHNRGIADLLGKIKNLLPQSDSPSIIHDSPAVAIVGRPNVGKSSFINAIVGCERAIASEIAGTTRDAVDIFYQRGNEQFTFIDTAGIRRRGKHSSSVEVFSVMRAEKTIRRADICVLLIDLTAGVTAQDKRIAGLIQKERKPCIIVLNKWDLVKPRFRASDSRKEILGRTRSEMFFLDYAPIVIASAKTGESIERLFAIIQKIRDASHKQLNTGRLNRILGAAFKENPPPLSRAKRLKLLYAVQATDHDDPRLAPPKFILFVNDPHLLNETYRRYLEARIREAEPFVGLPITLKLRARAERK